MLSAEGLWSLQLGFPGHVIDNRACRMRRWPILSKPTGFARRDLFFLQRVGSQDFPGKLNGLGCLGLGGAGVGQPDGSVDAGGAGFEITDAGPVG